MPQPTDPKRTGPPLDLTAEQLDQVAEVTPVDVAAARTLWLSAAPPKLADLLDAAPAESSKLRVDEPPLHVHGCDGVRPCPACQWIRDRAAEDQAWHRWRDLVVFYPCDTYGRIGYG